MYFGDGHSGAYRGRTIDGKKGGVFRGRMAGYGEEAFMSLGFESLGPPAVWRTSSGVLRALFNVGDGSGGMKMSESDDDGLTWSGAAAVEGTNQVFDAFDGIGARTSGARATQLPSSGAPISVATQPKRGGRRMFAAHDGGSGSGGGRGGSDTVVMAWNNMRRVPTPPGGRVHLALAMSLDGGDTWPHVRDLEPGGTNDIVPRGDEPVMRTFANDGGSGGGFGGIRNFRRLLADRKKDSGKDSKSTRSKSSSSSSRKKSGASKKPAPKKSSVKKKKPPRRRHVPHPVYSAPAPLNEDFVNEDEKGGWYDSPSVIIAKDGRVHVAYGYRGLTIKHVVVDLDWLRASTAAEPKTTGLFKGDAPTPGSEQGSDGPEQLPGSFEDGNMGGTSGGLGVTNPFGEENGGGQIVEDPDPMATFLAHARAHQAPVRNWQDQRV